MKMLNQVKLTFAGRSVNEALPAPHWRRFWSSWTRLCPSWRI